MVRVVATFPTVNIEDAAEARSLGVTLLRAVWSTESDLADALSSADIVLTRQTVPLTEGVIARMQRCRLIHNAGTGHSGIDVAVATRHGIPVSHPGSFCTDEVAEHTMALVLASVRKLVRLDAGVREGLWVGYDKPGIAAIRKPMFRIRGSTLGIVGYGRIGRRVAEIARGMGFRIVVHSPSVPAPVFAETGVTAADLSELLKRADVVALTGAARREGGFVLGQEALRLMKPTAFLVNCAHGSLVDIAALQQAISDGTIAGAALDVVPGESLPAGHPLTRLDNVILTASSAGYSETSYSEMRRLCWEAVRRVLAGELPDHLLNPEVEWRLPRSVAMGGAS